MRRRTRKLSAICAVCMLLAPADGPLSAQKHEAQPPQLFTGSIGPSTGDRSIFLATGHEGLGITTSLATARLLADQITGTTSEIPIEPYLPSRTVKEQVHA